MENSHYINGDWIEGRGTTFQAQDKCTLETFASYKSATAEEIERAVSSAQIALTGWSGQSDTFRAGVLERYAAIIRENQEFLAQLISRETGKPLAESRQETQTMAAKIGLSIQARMERQKSLHKTIGQDARSSLIWKPLGVVAVYGPFNMPGHLPGSHIVPALLAGNAIVFKPSEFTPATGAWIARALHESGLPQGVFQCVQGQKSSGVALANCNLDGIFFTGSSPTGLSLAKHPQQTVKRLLALEMGGNNALVVHQISDVRAAARQTILSAYITAGQRCTCARRLLVPQGAEGDCFVEELIDLASNIRAGFYNDNPAPFMGPVISKRAAEQVLQAQASLQDAGARVLLEARRLRGHPLLLSPGLLDVSAVAELPDEEIFGPLLFLKRTADFKEAMAEANRTAYGLAAGLLCDSKELWHEFRSTVQAGVINWNRQTTGASGELPFGGTGLSGNYRPGGYFAIDYCAYPVASLEAEHLQAHAIAGVED